MVVAQPMSIETTLVGSYPLPDWLRAHPSEQGLTDATSVVIQLQREAGIDLLTDGEFYRFDVNHPETNGMIEYFVEPLLGVRSKITRSDVREFHSNPDFRFRRKPAGVVEGQIGEGTLDLPAAWQRVKNLALGRFKFTLTSPYMLGRTVLDHHYGSLEDVIFAIADVLANQVREIDAEVVQVDEANLPGRPQDCELAAEAVNRVLEAVPGKPAVHVCFGNYGGQKIQSGEMAALVPFFERLRVDHWLLESARPGISQLEPLKELTNARFGVGVIDIKDTVIELPETIARRLEGAAQLLGGPERIAYAHPDCGFWVLPRHVADGKIRALKTGRDLFEGRPE